MCDSTFICLKVFVRERNSSQGLTSVEIDLVDERVSISIVYRDLLPVFIEEASARLKNTLGCALHV